VYKVQREASIEYRGSSRSRAQAHCAQRHTILRPFSTSFWLSNLLAHGYLSTSFFFLLSGFILSYLAIATATLTQAWVPPLVPIWSWPPSALSAVVFLYLLMRWLVRVLAKLSRP
jgi:hypothetical protein